MKKFLNAFNKTLAFALAIVMTVSLFSSWSLHSLAEDEVAETVAETMATPIATPAPTVAPVSTEAPTETEVPTTTEAPVATATPNVEEKFDVQATYDALMACTEYAQVEAIASSMSETQQQEFLASLSEEQANELTRKIDGLSPQLEAIGESVMVPFISDSFTNVAPLVNSASIPYSIMTLALLDEVDETLTDNSGIITEKTAVADGNGKYTITLDAYTTGQTISSSETVPCDIVLVLDQSGSMANEFGQIETEGAGWKYEQVITNRFLQSDNEYWNQGNGGISANYPATGWSAWQNADQYFIEIEYGDYVGLETAEYQWPTQSTSQQAFGFYNTIEGFTDADGREVPLGEWIWVLGEDGNDSNLDGAAYRMFWNGKPYYTRTWDGGTTETITRLEALKIATKAFISNVQSDANANNVDHRIAVVGFASGANYGGTNYKYENTELFNGASQTKYDAVTTVAYQNAFKDTSEQADVTDLNASIDALAQEGGTLINLGMDLAEGVFENDDYTGENTNRKKVVVVFTDGQPGWSGFDTTIANDALNTSADLKAAGVTVYSVSVMEGADVNGSGNVNNFMHYLSSNYPEAISMSSPGNLAGGIVRPIPTEGDSYYLTADNTTALNTIFEKISEEVSSSTIDLGSQTVIKDIVSPYFTIPENTSDIKLYLADYDGAMFGSKYDAPSTVTASIDKETRTISVTGFDFNANYVEEGKAGGKKLIIEFVVQPEYSAGFVGGNNVPTNGNDSGVYDKDGNLIEHFERPAVNVPIQQPTINVSEKVIYQGTSINATQLFTGYKIVNDQFVSTTVIYTDAEGNEVTPTSVTPNDCTNYMVTVKYTPRTDGTETENNGGGTANRLEGISKNVAGNIHVLKPEVTVTVDDIERNYGADYTLGEGNSATITVTWTDEIHNKTTATGGTIPFTKDDLELVYSTTQFEGQTGKVPSNDFNVTVKVQKNGEDYTTNVTITTNCSYGCSPATHTGGYYTVHVKSLPLTINKTFVEGTVPQVGETFIFTVKGTGRATSSVNMTVTLVAEKDATGQIEVAPITINNLPIGEYKVTEDTSWNWRYKPVDESGNEITDATYTITLGAVQEVTFKNKVVNNKWIDSNAYCENIFAAVNTSGSATSTKVQVK